MCVIGSWLMSKEANLRLELLEIITSFVLLYKPMITFYVCL